MSLIGKTYRDLQYRLLVSRDVRSAIRALVSSGSLSEDEQDMVRAVSCRIHSNDGMYFPQRAVHYLSAGLSAIRCIERVLEQSGKTTGISRILDLPCGYGRVLRFLRARFPDAKVTVSEIDPEALRFCESEFSAQGVLSAKDVNTLDVSSRFDLIWCGSLLTHLNEEAATDLLRWFYDHLLPDGRCVVTTHGQSSVKRLVDKQISYGLSSRSQQELLSGFYESGYGYTDYEQHSGYGIAVVSRDRLMTIARSVGQWDAVAFLDRAWDDHQDVYCFRRAGTSAG